MFGSLRKMVSAAAGQAKADYQGNKDFLEACCAASALVAYADGDLEAPERAKAMQIMTKHATLSKLYKQHEIEQTLGTMLERAETRSGQLQLMRELQDVRGKEPNTMAEDAYMVGLDIAFADGELEKPEVDVLNKIAATLGVDLKKLGLHEMMQDAK